MLNLTTIAEMCGKDVKTVSAWLSLLESSGLACWLLGWNTPEQMVNGAMWGHIFESFVFAEILKSYYNQGIVKPPLYYYRDKDKNEIDLIIKDGDVLYPVEIKTTSDPTKSMIKAFALLEKIPNISRGQGAVVCLAKERLPLMDKVWICPASLL